jgi:carbon-monoxide dehydrogenase medium subunit
MTQGKPRLPRNGLARPDPNAGRRRDILFMNAFEYLEPKSVHDAARYLAEYGTRARILAGGTDLMVQMEIGRHTPEAIVYLGRIPELRQITWDRADGLTVGATATLREVENHPAVVEHFPALARGAREVGSVQIRNLGTLAGNVCNASPSADTAPALLAYDAAVEIADASGGRRIVAIDDFWKGPGITELQEGEMVASVRLPAPLAGLRSFYQKLSVRKAMDLAMVGLAITLLPRGGGAERVRIALGAVGPTPFRAGEAEATVERGGIAAIPEAAALAEAAASPINDQRASAAYRREMVRVLTARGLTELLG